jgi:hypothetical protein
LLGLCVNHERSIMFIDIALAIYIFSIYRDPWNGQHSPKFTQQVSLEY